MNAQKQIISNKMGQNNLRIAIQKEGRLKEASQALLKSWGLKFSQKNERAFIVPCQNAKVEILSVRHSDIPQYVQSAVVDFGIVGENVLYENNFKVRLIKKLGFGQCKLVIAVPVQSALGDIADLEGERIATSHPNSLRKFLEKQKLNAAVIKINGAVEIAPALGLAEAICDLSQTGNTLKENNLKPIATLFRSEAVLITSMTESKEKFDFISHLSAGF